MHCIYTRNLIKFGNALEYHVYYPPPSRTTSSSVSCNKTESWLHHQLTRTAALLRCRRGSLHCGIYHSLCSFVLLANQPVVFFSHTKSASVTSQTVVLFSHNKWAPAIAKRTECAFTTNFWGCAFQYLLSVYLLQSWVIHIQTLTSKCFCTSCLRYMYIV